MTKNGSGKSVCFIRLAPHDQNQCARRTRNREINHCALGAEGYVDGEATSVFNGCLRGAAVDVESVFPALNGASATLTVPWSASLLARLRKDVLLVGCGRFARVLDRRVRSSFYGVENHDALRAHPVTQRLLKPAPAKKQVVVFFFFFFHKIQTPVLRHSEGRHCKNIYPLTPKDSMHVQFFS